MALTVTVRQGGTAGAVDRDYTSEIQFWDPPAAGGGAPTPKIRGGIQWDQGAAAQGEFYVTDDTAAVGGSAHKLGAHCRVFMVENAAGCDYWLSAGRIDSIEWDPGDHPWGNGRQAHVTFSDANTDLKGLALTENWTRAAETDYARLVALQAYTLAGTASTRPDVSAVHTYRPSTEITVLDSHLAKNANTVTMPAKTYPAGTEIMDIVSDCATSAGKRFGVVIHHAPLTGTTTMSWSSIPTSASSPPHWPYCGAVQKIVGLNNAAGGTAAIGTAYHSTGEGPNGAVIGNVVVSGSDTNRLLLAFTASDWNGTAAEFGTLTYRPNFSSGSSANDQSFTQIGAPIVIASTADDSPTTKGIAIQAWYLIAPAASAGATNGEVFSNGEDGYDVWSLSVYRLTGVDQTSPIADTADVTANGSTTSSGAVAGSLIVDGIAYRTVYNSAATATAGAGQTNDVTEGNGVETFGIMNTVLQTSYKTGSANDSCSHLCLQYIVPTDTTTNVSACAISDDPAVISPDSLTAPVFAPIWDQGPSLIQDVSEAVGGIVSTYTNGTANAFTVSLDSGWPDVHDYWTIGASDSQSVNSTQAAARAAAMRASLRGERHTGQATVKVRATQAHLLAAGQLINISSIRGEGGSAADRRIAQLIWEPIAPEVGTVPGWYYAHMQLDRLTAIVPDANGSSAAVGANTAANAAGTAQATTDAHIADTTAAHAASAVSIADAGGYYTGTDVEAALQELGAGSTTGEAVIAPASAGTAVNLNYAAFPALCQLDATHVLMVYRRGTDHSASLDGNVYARVFTLNADGTVASVGSESTVWDHATLDLRDPSVSMLADGTIVVTDCTASGTTISDNFIGYTTTATWNGSALSAWSTPHALGTTYGTGSNHREIPSDRVIELPNGKYGLALSAKTAAASADSAVFLYGTSLTGTWTEVVIAAGDATHFFTEPQVAVLDTGRLFCLIRENDNFNTWYSVSDDYGVTWSTAALLFSGFGKPRVRQLESGALLCIYRQNDGGGATTGRSVYRASYDRGATWSAEANVDANTVQMQYADLQRIHATKYVLAAWGIQNSSTDADILYGTFTDITDVRSALTPWLRVREEDGAPSYAGVRELRFTNGSVTQNSDGSISVNTGGGTLDGLSDVTITSPSAGQRLRYNGSLWVNTSLIWQPLTDGASNLIFAGGDVVMVEA